MQWKCSTFPDFPCCIYTPRCSLHFGWRSNKKQEMIDVINLTRQCVALTEDPWLQQLSAHSQKDTMHVVYAGTSNDVKFRDNA